MLNPIRAVLGIHHHRFNLSVKCSSGSYIGLEFAQVYRRFGCEVTVIDFGPRLISRGDEDVSQAVAGFLKEEGIDVRVNSEVVGVEKQGNSIVAKVESSGRVSQIAGTHLLVATGRRPNTDDLGLDKAVSAQTRAGISWWMTNCAPTFPVSGRWATAMAKARSRTRPGMISRSWQRISSTKIRDG